MEKRRRARINESLSQLKTLILDALKKDVSGNAAFFFFSIKMKYHFSGTKRETRPPPPPPAGGIAAACTAFSEAGGPGPSRVWGCRCRGRGGERPQTPRPLAGLSL